MSNDGRFDSSSGLGGYASNNDFDEYEDEEDENLFTLGKKERSKWNEEQTLLLLALYENENEKFEKKGITSRMMWTMISRQMSERGYKWSSAQCSSKMDSLKRSYRKVKDHNSQSGNDRRTCPYYEILDELFHNKKFVNPLSIAGSNIPLHDVDSDEDEKPNKKRRRTSGIAKEEFMQKFLENQKLRIAAIVEHNKRVEELKEERLKVFKDAVAKLTKD